MISRLYIIRKPNSTRNERELATVSTRSSSHQFLKTDQSHINFARQWKLIADRVPGEAPPIACIAAYSFIWRQSITRTLHVFIFVHLLYRLDNEYACGWRRQFVCVSAHIVAFRGRICCHSWSAIITHRLARGFPVAIAKWADEDGLKGFQRVRGYLCAQIVKFYQFPTEIARKRDCGFHQLSEASCPSCFYIFFSCKDLQICV